MFHLVILPIADEDKGGHMRKGKYICLLLSTFMFLPGCSSQKSDFSIKQVAKSAEMESMPGGGIMHYGRIGYFNSSHVFFNFYNAVYYPDFPFGYYAALRIPGFSFEKGHYLRVSLPFSEIDGKNVYTMEETFTKDNINQIRENADFVVTQDGDDLFVALNLQSARNEWKGNIKKPGGSYTKDHFAMMSIEFEFTDGLYMTNLSMGEDKKFYSEEFAMGMSSREAGMKWVSSDRFEVLVDELEISIEELYPTFVLANMTYPEYEKNDLYYSVITGFDKSFGDYYGNNNLILNGKNIEYKFTMKKCIDKSKGYESEKNVTLSIRSKDSISPRILVDDMDAAGSFEPIKVSYTKTSNEKQFQEELKSRITISDNSGEDIIPEITYEGFEPNQLKQYEINIKAVDSSGNKLETIKTVSVVDDIPPEITMKADEIEVYADQRLSNQELLEYVGAYDEIDKDGVTIEVTDNPYHLDANYSKPGSYLIEFGASDKSSNTEKSYLKVVVIDKNNGDWRFEKGTLYIKTSTVLSAYNIVEKLIEAGEIDDVEYTEVRISSGNAINGNNEVGKHSIELEIIVSDKESLYVNLNVIVEESNEILEEAKVEGGTFWDWIVNFFKSIGDFFKKLFGIS